VPSADDVRAVVDTNKLLSGLFWRGRPHALMEQVRGGTLTLRRARRNLRARLGRARPPRHLGRHQSPPRSATRPALSPAIARRSTSTTGMSASAATASSSSSPSPRGVPCINALRPGNTTLRRRLLPSEAVVAASRSRQSSPRLFPLAHRTTETTRSNSFFSGARWAASLRRRAALP
jgi:hypothetical protein